MNKFAISVLIAICMSLFSACVSKETNISVSNVARICAQLPSGIVAASDVQKAHDFEVTDLDAGAKNGTIYVGDFPDYPGFRPDRKYREPIGAIHYLGQADRGRIRGYLYRFGMDKVPSLHVLVQIPADASVATDAWERGAATRIAKCQ